AGLRAVRWAADDGYLIVLTQLDGKDWVPGARAEEILERIRPRGGEGAVILLHDAGGDRSATVEATDQLLGELSADGYRFTTVSGALGRASGASMKPAGGAVELRGSALIWGLRLSDWVLASLQVVALVLAVLLLIRSAVSIAFARRHARRPPPPLWLDPPPVTVVVPAYNEAAGIEAAVRSIASSRYPQTEVIVVDDGSTDDTAALVQAMGLANVRLISKENGGKSTALNRGVMEASHEIIVTVDGDTMFEPDTLFWLVQHLQDPAVGAVAGNTKVANRRGLLGLWQHLEYVVGFNYDRRAFDLYDCMATVPGAIGAFRRSGLVGVGLFTDDTLAEDTDITIALNRAGWYVPYEQRAVAWTEAPATLRGLWRQRYRWSYGTMQALWKHRTAIFERDTGRFGRRALPYIVVFQILLPLLGPVVDVFALYGLLFDAGWSLAAYYAGFTAVHAAVAAYALRLDSERLRDLWVLPLQLFVYRQLMYLVIVQSVASAISGTRLRWQRLDRVGVGSAAGLSSAHLLAVEGVNGDPVWRA
ncbi:MAG: glycosyltransferase, partial [Actinomycetota bacterium]|nr:glycosyltransferase [Actinomycetota bacterium]